jgi:hypothetical protein
MLIQSWTGKQLAQFADSRGEPIMHVVWRADLYRALYDEARRRGRQDRALAPVCRRQRERRWHHCAFR